MFSKSGDLFESLQENYDESKWRLIDLPHDWAVELDFQNDPGLVNHGFKPLDRNYPATSIGWYRRVFEIPASDLGRRLSHRVRRRLPRLHRFPERPFPGRNMSGYAPFTYDVTDFLNYGAKNILVVRVDATQGEGWFYEGAGIYRHVWLVKTHPAARPAVGNVCKMRGAAGGSPPEHHTEVENESDADQSCRVLSTIADNKGAVVASAASRVRGSFPPGAARVPAGSGRRQSAFWSLEAPHLYLSRLLSKRAARRVDRYPTRFGIRTIKFDPDEGFFLNGQPVKIQGTCNHQDHAGVGSALPDRIQYYRIEKLKEMGVNGYRTSHNAPTPELAGRLRSSSAC